MANYQTPGVYVEEIASLPGTIVGVPTAIPCFIGYTELHDKNVPVVDASNNSTYPVKISSLADYERLFGGSNIGLTLPITALGSGTTPADWVLGTPVMTTNSGRHLMHPALQHYFMNGGGPCYIVSLRSHVAASPIVDGVLHLKGITASGLADEVTLLVMPDAVGITTTGTTFATVAQAALAECAARKDRMVLLDVPGNAMAASGAADIRTAVGSEYLSYGAAYGPRLETSIPVTYSDRNLNLEIAIGAAGNETGTTAKKMTLLEVLQLIADNPAGTDAVKYSRQLSITNLRQYVDVNFAAILPSHINLTAEQTYRLPPSAAIAGLYAQTDRDRAVWVAPANIAVSGVKAVAERFTPTQLDDFNVPTDGYGKAINVIRTVQGRGHLVMGARTLLGNSLEWRYVSVRRTFLYIEESISLALAPIVFEPNDFGTWSRVRTMVSGFLSDLWRQGALMGKKPEEAFFVKVGLGSSMTPEDILAGRLIVEIGVAAVRPAEFIILRFSHLLQQG